MGPVLLMVVTTTSIDQLLVLVLSAKLGVKFVYSPQRLIVLLALMLMLI